MVLTIMQFGLQKGFWCWETCRPNTEKAFETSKKEHYCFPYLEKSDCWELIWHTQNAVRFCLHSGKDVCERCHILATNKKRTLENLPSVKEVCHRMYSICGSAVRPCIHSNFKCLRNVYFGYWIVMPGGMVLYSRYHFYSKVFCSQHHIWWKMCQDLTYQFRRGCGYISLTVQKIQTHIANKMGSQSVKCRHMKVSVLYFTLETKM